MENIEFYNTKQLFRTYITDPKIKSYKYDDWMRVPYEGKVAALYLTFYNTIYKAWTAAQSFYTESAEGVETILQYLQKNVPLIEANPSKYSAKYIYRVAYNCLYCLCHDYLTPKLRYELETSLYRDTADGEFDILDSYNYDDVDIVDKSYMNKMSSNFWDVIESDMSDDYVAEFVDRSVGTNEPYRVLAVLLPDGTIKTQALRMSPKRKQRVIALLKQKYAKYAQALGYPF